jgi:hypothetical protein
MLFSQEVFELRETQQCRGYRPGWVWHQLQQRYRWFSLEELQLIANVLNYRSGWAYHQFKEWGPPPAAPPPIPSKLQRSLELLGLRLPIDELALKRAYRQCSLQAHPDAGGTHAAFLALSEAYEHVKQHFSVGGAV